MRGLDKDIHRGVHPGHIRPWTSKHKAIFNPEPSCQVSYVLLRAGANKQESEAWNRLNQLGSCGDQVVVPLERNEPRHTADDIGFLKPQFRSG